MSASNFPGLAFPKHQPTLLEKADKDRAKLANWEKVKREVRRRDKGLCRCCGKQTKMPPHHLWFRSKGGPDATWNCLLLCAICHPLAQHHISEPSQLDANKPITWTRVR